MSNTDEPFIARTVDKSVDKLQPAKRKTFEVDQDIASGACLPSHTRAYVAHVHGSVPIRKLARAVGKHPSTILRQVRRVEACRDDPLLDAALDRIGDTIFGGDAMKPDRAATFISQADPVVVTPVFAMVLAHLAVTGTVLALAQDLDKAVVVRDGPEGSTERLAVVDRAVASALVLQDWIAPDNPQNRIVRYRITPAGRVALRDCDAGADLALAEDPGPDNPRANRYGLPETPLMQLARRKDRAGIAFLSNDLVRAGERLREDYELAQLDPDKPDDWLDYCAAAPTHLYEGATTPAAMAHGRVASALSVLGPGLGDVAFSCCCALDGLEKAEKRLGWAARSGKIVLRIALIHLARHYGQALGDPMIG